MNDSSITAIYGLIAIATGLSTWRNPRLQGARDVKAIESEEVGSGERWGAYLIGGVFVLFGLALLYLAF
ncbi:hypothetical protein [Haloarchaeobius sp. DFWS5]|uniref:hypothetical protein n=1 Tax=Haloarchaeobius sp. DFWS5 TaxID=3446114 RepID=UPI003EB6CDD8